MPASFVVRLTPRTPFAPATWAGPSLHAAFLGWVARVSPELAAALHDHPAPKPYTLSDLLTDGQPGLAWRWTALDARTREAMLAVLTDLPAQLSLLGIPCKACWEPDHPWAAVTDHGALRARSAGPVVLTFATPTSFQVHGRPYAMPAPRLLLQSALARWNAFAPRPLADTLPADAERHLVVSEATIRPARAKAGKKEVTGFTGRIVLDLVDAPPELAAGVLALLAYLPYCGAGVKTAMGLGAILPTGPSSTPLTAAPPATVELRTTTALAPAASAVPPPPPALAPAAPADLPPPPALAIAP